MKRRFLPATFLILIGNILVFSQMPPRDLNQIRSETSARNDAIADYDRSHPNNIGSSVSGNAIHIRFKIPNSAIRSYVLAAQATTEVTVLSVSDGDKLLVSDGTNKAIVHILGIDAPESGQPFYTEAKENLEKMLTGKKVVLSYSLHNLKDAEGCLPAQVIADGKDVGLKILESGLAWRIDKDKFFFEKEADRENEQAETKAQSAKAGIWHDDKPQKPWEYREKSAKEKSKAAKN